MNYIYNKEILKLSLEQLQKPELIVMQQRLSQVSNVDDMTRFGVATTLEVIGEIIEEHELLVEETNNMDYE
jgi:hypothetical protein